MNERIRELAEQAASEFTQTFNWEYLPQIDKDIFEKFAELIVCECADVVSSRPYIDDGNWSHPSAMIKKTFGVDNR